MVNAAGYCVLQEYSSHRHKTSFYPKEIFSDIVTMFFSVAGKYTRINLNLPKKILIRSNNLEYIHDPPLTEVGKLQAQLTGKFHR
jgi:hypothetical protein